MKKVCYILGAGFSAYAVIETIVKKDSALVSVTIGGAVTLQPRIPLP
jgi:hypothetical protein